MVCCFLLSSRLLLSVSLRFKHADRPSTQHSQRTRSTSVRPGSKQGNRTPQQASALPGRAASVHHACLRGHPAAASRRYEKGSDELRAKVLAVQTNEKQRQSKTACAPCGSNRHPACCVAPAVNRPVKKRTHSRRPLMRDVRIASGTPLCCHTSQRAHRLDATLNRQRKRRGVLSTRGAQPHSCTRAPPRCRSTRGGRRLGNGHRWAPRSRHM